MTDSDPAAPGPTWEQLVIDLTDVGVPTEQARIYLLLARKGPSSAGDLAQALRLSRPRVYRLLDLLCQQGFVSANIGRPRIFDAAPPAALVRVLREKNEAQQRSLEKIGGILATRIAALRKESEPFTSPLFTVVRGRHALAGAAHELTLQSRKSLDVLIGQPPSHRLLEGVSQAKSLAEKGVAGLSVRLLHPPTLPVPRSLQGLQRRYVNHGLASFSVADGKEALLVVDGTAQGPSHDGAIGVRSNAASFVETQVALFDRLWLEGAVHTGSNPERRR